MAWNLDNRQFESYAHDLFLKFVKSRGYRHNCIFVKWDLHKHRHLEPSETMILVKKMISAA